MPANATLEIDITLLGWKKVEKVTGGQTRHAVWMSSVCAGMWAEAASVVEKVTGGRAFATMHSSGGTRAAQPGPRLQGAVWACTGHGKRLQQAERMPVPRSACLLLQTADDGLVVKKTLEDTEEWKKPNAGEGIVVRAILHSTCAD